MGGKAQIPRMCVVRTVQPYVRTSPKINYFYYAHFADCSHFIRYIYYVPGRRRSGAVEVGLPTAVHTAVPAEGYAHRCVVLSAARIRRNNGYFVLVQTPAVGPSHEVR